MSLNKNLIVCLLVFFISQCLCLDDETKTNIDLSEMTMDKRQLVPLPRIGKRQTSILPSPRIGRSDKSSNGESLGSFGTENLIEPLDVQLRAAFIPRLGKRSRNINEDLSRSNDYADANKYRQLVMIPGLGYRYFYPSLNQIGSEDELFDSADESFDNSERAQLKQLYENAKRTIPYTPRIGRAVFAPRIGKKATFVPRIG